MAHTVLHLHIPTHFILYHKLSVFAIANVIFSQNLPFRISFNRSASPYGNIDHNRSASPYGNIDHSRSASPYGNIDHNHLAFALRPHRPQPPRFHPTATSTTTAPLHPTVTSTITTLLSPYGRIDHNRSASPYGHIDHNRLASPYGRIDHSPSFRTTKPF